MIAWRICASGVALLVAASCSLGAATHEIKPAARIVAQPIFTPAPTAVPTPVPTPVPQIAKPKPRAPKPKPVPVRLSGGIFDGLGGWIDVYDHGNEAAWITGAVNDMANRGVQTLYLESARFNSPSGILYPVAINAALKTAHDRGMKVVAWYPPDFLDVDRDVRFSVEAIRHVSPEGHRFDGFAPDVERMDVKDDAERTARFLDYTARVRIAAGPDYPMAAIVIAWSSPYYRRAWSTFPWSRLKEFYSVVMPMSYWTGRKPDVATAAEITRINTVDSGALSGLPVHTIGGVADAIDVPQAKAYVDVALQYGSIGGGLYDYRTQFPRPELWSELTRLRR